MKYTHYAEVEALSPSVRHSFCATNCFQHAIGYQGIILSLQWERILRAESEIKPPKTPRLILGYVALQPGNTHAVLRTADMATLRAGDVDAVITQGCAEEGIIETGGKIETQSETHRPLALYLRERGKGGGAAFHFVRQEDDGTWSGRFPYHAAEHYTAPPQEIGDYRLARFFSAPKDIPNPVGVRALSPHRIVGSPCDGRVLRFDVIAPEETPFQMPVFCDLRRGFAIAGNPDSPYAEHFPLPAFPDELLAHAGKPEITIVRPRPAPSPLQGFAAAYRSLGFV